MGAERPRTVLPRPGRTDSGATHSAWRRFHSRNPQVVVEGPFATILPGIQGRMYDVSRDGQRFLMIRGGDSDEQAAPPPQIVVVQNWFEELKRLAPVN